MILLLINQSNISRDFSLRLSKRLEDSDWTDWNRANTENIRIGLVFVVLAQWKFIYLIDIFDHIKANKSKLINNVSYYCINYRLVLEHVTEWIEVDGPWYLYFWPRIDKYLLQSYYISYFVMKFSQILNNYIQIFI